MDGGAFSAPFSAFDFASRQAVVAAVSGGSDSTALLILLKRHLDRTAPATRLVALTVDHGLRTGSAAEAEAVGRLCAALGVAHRVLCWIGPKPSAGIAAAARMARYGLLAAAAREAGSDLVVTGHTADDQAETVAMRQARDGGPGLAGMAPVTLFEGTVWIARPLLGFRRQALRDFLAAEKTGWSDDPTNSNAAYERPRMRAALAADPARMAQALRLATDEAGRRVARGEAAAALLDDHARLVSPGLVRLDTALLDGADADVALALRILLACLGGARHLPDAGRVAALLARLRQGPMRAVLSRTLVDRRKDAVFLLREARGLPAPAAVGESGVWDGRYRILAAPPGATLGPAGRLRSALLPADGVPDSLVRAAQAVEPALFTAAGVPSVLPRTGPGCHAVPLLAPWAAFLPGFDLVPARAAAALLGTAKIPASPSPRHDCTGP